MKPILKAVLVASLLVGLAGLGFGQTSLTQTTLSAAQGDGPAGLASGNSTAYSSTISLASATGIQAASNGSIITYVYVGGEVEGILSLVTGQTTVFNVLRAQMGTKAAPHPSGDMVLAQVVTPQFGGNAGSGGLQQADPPKNGACTVGNTLVTPWVNVNTGAQWLCSPITGTWVPGFNNPAQGDFPGVTAAVASASAITPSGPLFHVTGTTAITSFTIPVGFNATAEGGGSFCMIPDGLASTSTGNNIALGSTFVVNKLLCETWDAKNSKFVPSY